MTRPRRSRLLAALRTLLSHDRPPRPAPRRPRLEALEDRVVPTFGPVQSFRAGNALTAAAFADFNGDGRLDSAVSSFDGALTVSVLLGNGDATFVAGQSYATGNRGLGVTAGDLNNDGRIDLAVANASSA